MLVYIICIISILVCCRQIIDRQTDIGRQTETGKNTDINRHIGRWIDRLIGR